MRGDAGSATSRTISSAVLFWAKELGSRVELRPIGKRALDVVIFFPRPDGSPWVFPPARTDGHHVGLPGLFEQVRTIAELKGVTQNLLRHGFAATAAGMGNSELTVAGLLGHKVAAVMARYAHVPDRARVAAAEAIPGRISALLCTRSEQSAGADGRHL